MYVNFQDNLKSILENTKIRYHGIFFDRFQFWAHHAENSQFGDLTFESTNLKRNFAESNFAEPNIFVSA